MKKCYICLEALQDHEIERCDSCFHDFANTLQSWNSRETTYDTWLKYLE